jgi:hypothetical protein
VKLNIARIPTKSLPRKEMDPLVNLNFLIFSTRSSQIACPKEYKKHPRLKVATQSCTCAIDQGDSQDYLLEAKTLLGNDIDPRTIEPERELRG